MSTGMKGVVKFADRVEFSEFEPRALAAGQVRVRVEAAGVCGTDLHIAADEYAYEPPVVMGHEISGTVLAAADPQDEHWIGRRVVLETYFTTCNTCPMCRSGRRNLCAHRRSLGSFEDGGFAPEVIVPTINLHAVPDHVDSIDAVLMEPLACVANCLLDPVRIGPGEEVLVLGPGTMGLLAVQVARAAGARVSVTGLPHDAEKLRVAEGYGAIIAEEVGEEVYDVVIDTTGAGPAIAAGLRAAAKRGRFVELGIVGQEITVPWDLILYKELEVSSGFASTPQSWRRAVRLVQSGAVDLTGLVTARFPLERWQEAFDAVGGNDIKVTLVPE